MMIDLLIAYLILFVIVLLFIITFLTFYIIHEHRKKSLIHKNKDQIVLPLLTLNTNEHNHSNSAIVSSTLKRIRQQVKQNLNPKLYFNLFYS